MIHCAHYMIICAILIHVPPNETVVECLLSTNDALHQLKKQI